MAAMKDMMIKKAEAARKTMQAVYKKYMEQQMDIVKHYTENPGGLYGYDNGKAISKGEKAIETIQHMQKVTERHIEMMEDEELTEKLVLSCAIIRSNLALDYWDMLEAPGAYIPWVDEEGEAMDYWDMLGKAVNTGALLPLEDEEDEEEA